MKRNHVLSYFTDLIQHTTAGLKICSCKEVPTFNHMYSGDEGSMAQSHKNSPCPHPEPCQPSSTARPTLCYTNYPAPSTLPDRNPLQSCHPVFLHNGPTTNLFHRIPRPPQLQHRIYNPVFVLLCFTLNK